MPRLLSAARNKALLRAEDRVRRLATELSSTERVARALQAENHDLKRERAELRRLLAEIREAT